MIKIGTKSDAKIVQNRIKVDPKIDQKKSIPEGLGAKDGVMKIGRRFSSSENLQNRTGGPFLAPKLGAKLEPSCDKNPLPS